MSLVRSAMGMREPSRWLLIARRRTELKLQAGGLLAGLREARVEETRLQRQQRGPLQHQRLLLLGAAVGGAELLPLESSSSIILLLEEALLGPLNQRAPLCTREMARMRRGLTLLQIRVQRKDRIRGHSASGQRDAASSPGEAQRQQQADSTQASEGLRKGAFNEAPAMAV